MARAGVTFNLKKKQISIKVNKDIETKEVISKLKKKFPEIKELYKVGYNIGYKYPKVDSLVAQRYNKKTSEMTEEEYSAILNEFKRIVDAKNKVGA